ncbi:MAG: ferrous iron transport protein A, partial [Anaerolineae bacterium]|nr:ferrous iron transport protein A [Gemmatimonadaceae bacterium]
GLVPGARVTMLDRAPFGGPIRLRVRKAECAIGPQLAGSVWVEVAE